MFQTFRRQPEMPYLSLLPTPCTFTIGLCVDFHVLYRHCCDVAVSRGWKSVATIHVKFVVTSQPCLVRSHICFTCDVCSYRFTCLLYLTFARLRQGLRWDCLLHAESSLTLCTTDAPSSCKVALLLLVLYTGCCRLSVNRWHCQTVGDRRAAAVVARFVLLISPSI